MPALQVRSLIFATVAPPSLAFNPYDIAANLTLSNNYKTCTSASSLDRAVRSVIKHKTGKWYFEFHVDSAFGGDGSIGITTPTSNLTTIGSSAANGFYYYPSGNNYLDTALSFTGTSFTTGDVICMAFDADNNTAWTRKGSGNWNANAANDPATNTGGKSVATDNSNGMHAVWTQSNSGSAVTGRFVSADMGFTIPTGFTAWAGI
jgi:hypothetical protein